MALVCAGFPILGEAQGVPGGALPGRIEQDTRPQPEARQPGPPIVVPVPSFPEQAPAGAEQIQFKLGSVELVGNKALATPQLSDIWLARVGQSIRLSDVFEFAEQITRRYRQAGFVLSQAIVPVQQIDPASGVVRIQVLEGRIGSATVNGTVRGKEQIQAYLAPLTAESPARLSTLERTLLLVNELPGVTAQANLKASSELNASDLELQASSKRDAYSLSVHNRTSKAVGPLRFDGSAEIRGLAGAFDRHALRWVGSGNERLNMLAYSGDVPIGTSGLKTFWNTAVSKAKPKTDVPFQFDTNTTSGAVGLSYPVLRSRQTNLAVRGSIGFYNGKSDIDSTQISHDRLRPLRLGASFDYADAFAGVNLVDVEYSHGLSGLGATSRGDASLSRADQNPQFNKITLYAARLQSLGSGFSALVAISGQQSNDILSSAEQFGLGGELFLRAYDPSELLGDKGWAGKLEVRYNLSAGPSSVMLYGYHDAGYVVANQPGGGSVRQSGMSTGIGARFGLPYRIRGFVEMSKPNHKVAVSTNSERVRFFGGIGIEF